MAADMDLEDVVVDDAEGLGDLLRQGEDLSEVLVRNLVHPVRMVCRRH